MLIFFSYIKKGFNFIVKPFFFFLLYLFIFVNSFCCIDNLQSEKSSSKYNYIKKLEDVAVTKLLLNKNKDYPIYEVNVLGKSIFYFCSSHLIEPVSYSGKPIEFLIGIDEDCYIRDLQLLKHSEPILLVGIPLTDLLNAVSSYKDKCIKNSLVLGSLEIGSLEKVTESIKVITSATVTSLAVHSIILKSSRTVACDLKLMKSVYSNVDLTGEYKKYTWEQLVSIGAIKNFKQGDLLDVYYMEISHPSIGINIFGEEEYLHLKSTLRSNERILFIINNGDWSYKGSGWVRGGLFDRFRIEQSGNFFLFHDYDFKKLPTIICDDVADFHESGLFYIRGGEFKAAINWDLVFLYSDSNVKNKGKEFTTFKTSYNIPQIFIKKERNLYEQVWYENLYLLFIYFFLWLCVFYIFIKRKNIIKFSTNIFDYIYIITIFIITVFVGCICGGQPSIVNVLSVFNVFITKSSLMVFLMDVFFIVSWFFIPITLLIWGRSFFCGWFCPFGSLQELLYRLREFLTNFIYSYEVHFKIRNFLNYFRYFIFLSLLCISYFSLEKAEIFAEVEPFKTMWNLGVLKRGFLSMYIFFILFTSFFMYRWFCRFICPLGAFFSLFSVYTISKILRRNACVKCNICRKCCKAKAIDDLGHVIPTKCLGCFDCISAMYDNTVCPPLINIKIWDSFNEKE